MHVQPPAQQVRKHLTVDCTARANNHLGNGQSYASAFGETFRLNCGKRHGTTNLKSDKQKSLQDCMDSCASFIPCHSVDYHQMSQTCYYSNHHGEPIVATPGFSSAYSLGCTGACSGNTSCCCSCSTGTPPKPPGPPTADLSCGNQGFQYAIYPNKKADGTLNFNDSPFYGSFEAEVFKTAALQYSGKTTSVGISDCSIIYGNRLASQEYVAVNHRGYVFAQQAGEYTFSLPACDDTAQLWVGPNAYRGYRRNNANIVPTAAGQVYKITFEAGKYYPIRMLYANGQGPGSFSFKLTAPDGTVVIGDSTTADSPFLVQYSCDRTTAPPFPPFGSES